MTKVYASEGLDAGPGGTAEDEPAAAGSFHEATI
jgi:hypothetical protein